MKGKMNGLSLFTGYAGIDLALADYVRPIIYCEIEPFPQAIILSRMDEGSIPFAPIWDDVTTLNGSQFKGLVDIIYGGFPCQDISSAGKGAGLEGKRSGLFYEVMRICEEASPLFIFLENVAAIRTRGSIEVQEELATIGYDSRFGHLSAAEVGAIHERDRWFCLAIRKDITKKENASHSVSIRTQIQVDGKLSAIELLGSKSENRQTVERSWPTESPVCRTDDVPAYRMDRIKACGNGVHPFQVKTAFEILMGINYAR